MSFEMSFDGLLFSVILILTVPREIQKLLTEIIIFKFLLLDHKIR